MKFNYCYFGKVAVDNMFVLLIKIYNQTYEYKQILTLTKIKTIKPKIVERSEINLGYWNKTTLKPDKGWYSSKK